MKRQQNQRRPKGEGSITRLPNGRLKMTITVGVSPDGKQRRRSVSASNKTELLKKVSELRMEVSRKPQGNSPYFRDVVEAYLKEKEALVPFRTLKVYENVLKVRYEALLDVPMDKITADMIDDILDKMVNQKTGRPLVPSTLKEIRGRLSAVFNFALRRGMVDKTPMRATKVRIKNRRKADLDIPTESEMKAILRSTYGILKPLCLLAVATGCRLGELLDIRMEDIDLKKGTIDINSQRTGDGSGQPLKTLTSARIIYVHRKTLKEVLKDAPCTDGYLFGNESYGKVGMIIYRWLHQTPEVPEGFTFHTFRHYHATYLLKKGVDIKAVSKRLGHAGITTTLDYYAHWIPEVDRKAAQVIGGIL